MRFSRCVATAVPFGLVLYDASVCLRAVGVVLVSIYCFEENTPVNETSINCFISS